MASGGASPGDIAEFAAGKASAGDKRELGFMKEGNILKPGKHTSPKVRAAYAKGVKSKSRGKTTKARKVKR